MRAKKARKILRKVLRLLARLLECLDDGRKGR